MRMLMIRCPTLSELPQAQETAPQTATQLSIEVYSYAEDVTL